MNSKPDNFKLQIIFLHLAHVLAVLFFIGFVPFAHLLPAPSPHANAAEIAKFYVENASGIRIGATLMLISFGLWMPWGSVVIAWTRKIEGHYPILTYTQIASVAMSAFVALLCAFFWGVAAFRPGEVSPDVTMTLNDMGWLMFLVMWPPYSVWCLSVGLTVLLDASDTPLLPRWTGYLSLLTAFLFIPAALPLFFKSGQFAYNGLLGMFLPLLIFFIWVEGMTYALIKAIKREQALQAATR